jgi:hypothetical protein
MSDESVDDVQEEIYTRVLDPHYNVGERYNEINSMVGDIFEVELGPEWSYECDEFWLEFSDGISYITVYDETVKDKIYFNDLIRRGGFSVYGSFYEFETFLEDGDFSDSWDDLFSFASDLSDSLLVLDGTISSRSSVDFRGCTLVYNISEEVFLLLEEGEEKARLSPDSDEEIILDDWEYFDTCIYNVESYLEGVHNDIDRIEEKIIELFGDALVSKRI